MSALLAVNDGLTNNNWNEADVSFLISAILAALAAIAYALGVGTVAKPDPGPDSVRDATTATPVGPPTATHPWYFRFHEVAAALLALAVAGVAFGLFLQ